MAIGNNKKTAILLVNLGSPKAPTTREVRRYLREFLGDPRVVNLPRPLWWLILNLFILPFRPRKSAHAYQSIWTENGSPLTVTTAQLTEKVSDTLTDEHCIVDYAMRYGKPSLAEKLAKLARQNLDELIVLPLYPQYSSTTTAAVFDVLGRHLLSQRRIPGLRFIGEYHDDPGYIEALADSIRQFWQQHGRHGLLLMSFHGLPAKLTELGDPYYHQCCRTAQLLADNLGLAPQQWQLVFQSRFGKAAWLQPYCVEVLQQLPRQGVKTVDVVCPGFAVDCLETLEEIAIANRQVFIDAGGEAYRYIPALNDSDRHVAALIDLIQGR